MVGRADADARSSDELDRSSGRLDESTEVESATGRSRSGFGFVSDGGRRGGDRNTGECFIFERRAGDHGRRLPLVRFAVRRRGDVLG